MIINNDGFDHESGYFLEIKSTTRGTVYPTASIRSQLQYDSGGRVMWVFVGGSPSQSLDRALDVALIAYFEVYP
jgi:hypothetical protein